MSYHQQETNKPLTLVLAELRALRKLLEGDKR